MTSFQYCYQNPFCFRTFRGKLALFGISKFKYEKKNEMDFGSNSKITQMAY